MPLFKKKAASAAQAQAAGGTGPQPPGGTGPQPATPSGGQPAYKTYPFSQGWQVLRYVWANIFQQTKGSSESWFDAASSMWERGSGKNALLSYWIRCISAGIWLGAASQFVSALVVVTFFAAVQAVLLAVGVIISGIFMGLLWAGNYLYASIYRLTYRCPCCNEAMTIPEFICKPCNAHHTRLWPSWYGVFHHRCNGKKPDGTVCRTLLPTLDFLGRSKLERECPNCHYLLNSTIGTVPSVHVAVAGGSSVGKTYLLVAATRALIENYAPQRHYKVTFPTPQDQTNYEGNLTRLLTPGREIAKTGAPQNAYNLDIQAPHSALARKLLPRASRSKLAYVYDVMGENFAEESQMLTNQGFYSYVNALMFAIDPFAIPEFKAKHQSEIAAVYNALHPSDLNLETAYDNMQRMLERSAHLKPGQPTNRPLAVVITKVDALRLEDVIGAPAAQRLMQQDPTICLEEDAISLLVRNFLVEENKLGNLVRNLESQFSNIKYFSCSALGAMLGSAQQQGAAPIRIADPLIWALGFSRSVNSRSERLALADAQHRAQGKYSGSALRALRYYYWNSLKPQSLDIELQRSA